RSSRLSEHTEHSSPNTPNTMFGAGPTGILKVPRVPPNEHFFSLKGCSLFGGGCLVRRHAHLAGEHTFCDFERGSVAHEVGSERCVASAHRNVDPSASDVVSGTLTTFLFPARRRPTAPAIGSVVSSTSAIALVVIGPLRSARRKRSVCEALRVSVGESPRSNSCTAVRSGWKGKSRPDGGSFGPAFSFLCVSDRRRCSRSSSSDRISQTERLRFQ